MKLIKLLYGLFESGDLWHQTLDEHHKKEISMKQLRSDPPLCLARYEKRKVQRFSGGYVDDILRAGGMNFTELAEKAAKRFRMGDDEQIPCEFSGLQINKGAGGMVYHSQKQYLRQLEALPLDAPLWGFLSIRTRLAWLTNTQPDCMFEISQIAQVTNSMFKESKAKQIERWNKVVNFATSNPISLKINRQDLDSLESLDFQMPHSPTAMIFQDS